MKKLSVQMTKGLLSLGAITFAVVASPAFAQNLCHVGYGLSVPAF